MEIINKSGISSQEIQEGMKFLLDNYTNDSFSSEEYRALFLKLAAQFLKEEFGIDDLASISDEEYKSLYQKLVHIEIEEMDKDETEDSSEYSARGEMATSLVTEMGECEPGVRWTMNNIYQTTGCV
jgi:hypothetical protein